eukprot:CAMPEP_0170608702 /NCGR_PEP_ID=MMETSP0224-20130122/21726_1 /TAXON_ID=285029 /ORGANISM="Togula jolla, Strain CCCM 725" /LENGTH=370 /DNA_ID=CAMNT_0010933947 /DNA_START=95 /DNA_END=1207 /DNA_ORIENTATION=+
MEGSLFMQSLIYKKVQLVLVPLAAVGEQRGAGPPEDSGSECSGNASDWTVRDADSDAAAHWSASGDARGHAPEHLEGPQTSRSAHFESHPGAASNRVWEEAEVDPVSSSSDAGGDERLDDKTPMELHRLNHTAAKAIDTMPSKLWMGTPMTIREAEEEKIAEAINQTAGQVPEYPLYEEGSAHFNPAYYSEGEQVAELHLPHFTLTSLASSYQGPLAGFLTDLLQILANMSDVSKERIGILGLHGKFKKVSKAQLPSLGEDSASTTQQRAHEEVVVRFHIQDTGKENETSKKQVLSRLHAAILSPTSPLRIGPLANVMHNCTISVFAPGEKEQLPHTEMREETATRVSSMVLPIGISAAFTAVLIWLAAW